MQRDRTAARHVHIALAFVLAGLAFCAGGGGGRARGERVGPAKTACEGARPPAFDSIALRLDHGAFPGSVAEDVVVHVPHGFDAAHRPGVVVYFHGWMGCARSAMGPADTACREGGDTRTAANLAAQVDDARVNALVVAVELRADMPTGEAGRLAMPGGLRLLLSELLSSRLAPAIDCAIDVDGLDRVVLIAHSGGYLAAAAALEAGDVPEVTEVVLLDALYGAEGVFERWIRDDIGGFAPSRAARLRWVDLYTCCAGTAEPSRAFATTLEAPLAAVGGRATVDDGPGELAPAILRDAVVFKRVPVGHSEVPRTYVRAIVEAAGFAPIRLP
jgi:hypothetical protein